MTNALKPGNRLQRSSGRSTRTCVSPPVENPACAVFEKYGDVPERAAGDQAKTACGNLQMCAGLKASIEGDTHAMGQRKIAGVKKRQEGTDKEEVAGYKEEERGGIAVTLDNLNIETAVTEEEATEGLAVALEMQVEEDEGSDGEEGGGGTQQAVEALEFLTQEAESSGTTLIDARNGFNKLSRLDMLRTVQHRWTAVARFAFNCYWH